MNQRRGDHRLTRSLCFAAIGRTDAVHQCAEFAKASLGQQGVVGQAADLFRRVISASRAVNQAVAASAASGFSPSSANACVATFGLMVPSRARFESAAATMDS